MFEEQKKRGKFRLVLILAPIFAGVFILFAGAIFLYEWTYAYRVYPGIYAGDYYIGGMKEYEVKDLIESYNNNLAKEGISLLVAEDGRVVKKVKINPVFADDLSVEMVGLDSEGAAAAALAIGRSGGFLSNFFSPVKFLIKPARVVSPVKIDDRLFSLIGSQLALAREEARNANIKIIALYPLQFEKIKEKEGYSFDADKVREKLAQSLSNLELPEAQINETKTRPDIKLADLDAAAERLPNFLAYGSVALAYIDPQDNRRFNWDISAEQYSQWLEVKRDNEIIIGLNKPQVLQFIESLRSGVDREAGDAKIIIENGRAKEFIPSRSGVAINAEETYKNLEMVFRERNFKPAQAVKSVTLSVDLVKPNVELSSANDLGISDIIGAGTSTFKDSHTNRIKNIANAVKRLNGVLIKPGEEFSANKFAGPYTSENGFLPEMVIKGNRIIPEVGGGMCQIGTTLFRMAMNSGMPITQRRNHSLVVGYYADPVNGNPGTDATLYEPDVDFRFLNDTGSYLLVQTEIDYKKQMLTFTLWGKKDGRQGWYSRPAVSKWIPAGLPQEIEVDTLKPGEKQCQNAFRGAVASFMYTRITTSGEKIERVFDSYYRPLPSICLVGKAASTTVSGDVSPPL